MLQTIGRFIDNWAGAIVCLVHISLLTYWGGGGEVNTISIMFFIYVPIVALIVLFNRGGISATLGVIYLLAYPTFVVGLAYLDRTLLFSLYYAVLIALVCNDIIHKFMQSEQHHLASLE